MLTLQRLKEVLHYNRRTGLFTWNIKISKKVTVGSTAGTISYFGYIQIGIDKKLYLAHILAWFYVYGVWPTGEIDHKDTDKKNNRIKNLRDVTHANNLQNQVRARTDNKSTKLLGVTFDKYRGTYMAKICTDKKYKFLGRFETPELAHAAYVKTKRKYHSTCTI